MRLIIGLSGPAQSGKDTIANHLVQKYEFTRLAMADSLKTISDLYFEGKSTELYLQLYDLWKRYGNRSQWPRGTACAHKFQAKMIEFPKDLDNSDPPKPRLFLQALGDLLKTLNPEILALCLQEKLNVTAGNIIIPDIRFPHDAEFIRNNRGLMIRLDRKPHLNDREAKHTSEHAWKRIVFDYVLDSNDSVDTLLLDADILMEAIVSHYMEH